ncbi:MAG: hypothetical protein Q7U82_07485 [Gammaproteobacteria bacterium]|nr:hypothetical protein [Gammaproteobacteria bacterium]
MKCIYYLSPSLKSTQEISDDLHAIGVDDWYLHIVSKDESGLSNQRLHSSNYFETQDLLREGIIGGAIGLSAGMLSLLAMGLEPFGPNLPLIAYFGILLVLVGFGAWVGGMIGLARENKKLAGFHDDIEAGKYLILIYAKRRQEENIKRMMESRHKDVRLAAVDAHFLNPFSELKVSG